MAKSIINKYVEIRRLSGIIKRYSQRYATWRTKDGHQDDQKITQYESEGNPYYAIQQWSITQRK